MGLALVVGPAKAGKVARLLEGYLEQIDRDPVLIVPNRSDVERIERDLLARAGALLAGSIGTFDDVFRELALADPDARPVASDAQRALLARRALARTPLNGLGRSSRFAGFADSLLAVLGELESGLLDPEQLDGDLAQLYASYRAELDRLGLWDRDLLRRRAVERLRSELAAWDGRPVFAYGFEDLTGAEWGLLEALTARAQVTVSLPYEPARAAFASLRRTQEDLASLAAGAIEDLPARSAEYGHAALAHLERHLFADTRAGRRRRSTARSGSSREPGLAARWSSSPRTSASSPPPACRCTRSRSSFLPSSAGARRSRPCWARSRSRSRSRAGSASAGRRSGRRSSRCCVSNGSWAVAVSSMPSSARPTRASSARTSTSSRAGCAGVASPPGRASRRRRSASVTASRCRRSRRCAARRGRSRRFERSRPRCSGARTASTLRRWATPAAPTCARSSR